MYINIWIEQQDKMPSKAPFQCGCVIWIITSWWNFKCGSLTETGPKSSDLTSGLWKQAAVESPPIWQTMGSLNPTKALYIAHVCSLHAVGFGGGGYILSATQQSQHVL